MWFGDYVLAAALFEELHVKLTNAEPALTGVSPSEIPFTADQWCKPSVALHHIDSQLINDLYQYERKHNNTELLYRDLYHAAFPSGMPDTRADWNNYPYVNIEWLLCRMYTDFSRRH